MNRWGKLIPLTLLFSLALVCGAWLQKQQIFMNARRVIRGLPLKPADPSLSILLWNTRQPQRPSYPLDGLSLPEILANRKLYQEKIRDLLGTQRYPLQFRPPIEIAEKKTLGQLTREKILIETEPGLKIPFYLFLPADTDQKNNPVILVLHGHSAGKIETAGILDSYQHGNALSLAQAGYVTIAPDFRGFGELGWTGNWDDPIGHAYGRNIHIQDVLSNLERGRTALGTYLYDLRHILNYVKTRKNVDQHRIGIAGTSMGADVALWFTLLNTDIHAAVISHPPMLSLPITPHESNSLHPCVGTIPELNLFFNPTEIPLLAAPIPLQLSVHTSPQSKENARKVEWLYKTSGNTDKFSYTATSSGEDFDNAAAIEWFEKWLK